MRTSILIVGGTVLAGLALMGFWELASRPPAAERAPLVYVEEAVAPDYVDIPRLGILTSENFLGHRIRVIEGTVHNLSGETLRSIELRLEFKSWDGETVLAAEEEALRAPLAPEGQRRFEFRFENLPADWNFRVPEIEVARVGY